MNHVQGERESFEVIGHTKKEKISVSDEKMLLEDNTDTRRLIERCELKAKTVVNPIIDWKDKDIWGFIESEKIPMNKVYECGLKRAGCVGCPMAGKTRKFEFDLFPTYKQAYIHAFDRMIDERKRRGKIKNWSCGEEVFHWWIEDQNIYGQMSFDDFPELMPDDDY